MSNKAIIVGASYAGLSAAAALRCKGWEVEVLEKSADTGRVGGGVVVQKQMADYLEEHGIASPRVSSVPAKMRMMFQPDGRILHLPETAVAYTAWDVLLGEIQETVGAGRIRRGCEMTGVEGDSHTVSISLADGNSMEADLLVAADGIGSRTRKLLLPDERPLYAGYVAWRGMVPEERIPREVRDTCSGSLCSFLGNATSILAYLVPGADGSIEDGRRRVNWVWYLNVEYGTELDTLLTDSEGTSHRAMIPRGLMPAETERAVRHVAREQLNDHFTTIVDATEELFVNAVFDYHASRLVFGRVVLIGDASCLIRPHIGAGTSKAVDDAIQLSQAVTGPDFQRDGSLESWEQQQTLTHVGLMEQSKAIARRLGLGVGVEEAYMSEVEAV